MKVLFVHPNNRLTGQELSLVERMKGMQALGIDCALLVPEEGEFSDLVQKENFEVHFVPMHRLNKFNVVSFLGTVYNISQLVKKCKIDLLHCSGIYPYQYCLPASHLRKVPCIAQITTTIYTPYDVKVNWANRADLIIGCSESVKEHFLSISKLSGDRVCCVYDAIEDMSAKVDSEAVKKLRQEFALSDDTKVVGQLGEIIPRKGIEYFVEMAKYVKHRYDKVRFFLIGQAHGDEYEKKLRKMLKENGMEQDVIFTGYRKDYYNLNALLDVSVLASLAEGLGRVIVETQYMQKPIVATNVSGNAEAIEEGVTGFLVPPQEPVALGEVVLKLLNDDELRQRVGQMSRDGAIKRFNLKSHAENMCKLYKGLLTQ